MPAITLKNTPLLIDLSQAAIDNGWNISNAIAYHDSCFPGYIKLKNITLEPGKEYVVQYNVKYYTSGSVYPVIAGISGTTRAGLGTFTDQITVPVEPENLLVQFYSNGTLGIEYMRIYPVLEYSNNGVTLGFNADNNKWTTYYSYAPENMLKFVNDFFTFKNGRLWKHNKNAIRNNFYGVQGTSKLTVIVNANPSEIKNFFSMRMKTNKAWAATEIIIPPSEGKEDGQRSIIKSGNFEVLNNGDRFANFLKNMDDPRFVSELDALFKGADLQGSYAEITFECTSTNEVRLLSIDFSVNLQNYTY